MDKTDPDTFRSDAADPAAAIPYAVGPDETPEDQSAEFLSSFDEIEGKPDRSHSKTRRTSDRPPISSEQGDELFEQIALERSREAFSELYELLSPRAYGQVFRILKNEEDARDIVQEVFTLFWEKAPEFYQFHTNSLVWILQLARRRAIDEVRTSRFRTLRQTESYTNDRHESLLQEPHAPDEKLNVESVRLQIQAAMDILTPNQRKIMELKLGGKSYQEIADMLHTSAGTIRKTVFDSYRKLRPLFHSSDGFDFPLEKKVSEKKKDEKTGKLMSIPKHGKENTAEEKLAEEKAPKAKSGPRSKGPKRTRVFEQMQDFHPSMNMKDPVTARQKDAMLNELEQLLQRGLTTT